MNHNLFSFLRTRFPKRRGALFICTPDGRAIPYSKLDDTTARYAGALQQLGLTRGDRLVMLVDKSPEAILLYLAVLRLGAILVPLNIAYTAREFQYFLDDTQPKIVILQPESNREYRKIAKKLGARIETLGSQNEGTLPRLVTTTKPLDKVMSVNKDSCAAILYTSGTTGQPKGAMLTHGNLASNAVVLHKAWGFRPKDVLLHALPVFHVHGLFVAVHCAMLNGSLMIFLPKFDAGQVTNQLNQATVMMGVPTFYQRLLEYGPFGQESCRNIRLFISGSAPLLPKTWQAFRDKTGYEILERYGMSEAGMITSNPLDGERIPGTVGFALPEIELRICNSSGDTLSPGEVGVLEFRGPNLFKGYWRQREAMATKFRDDGFFISGDLASMDLEGRITIVGRDHDLIITGGFNVYPKEVEDRLNQLPGVIESAVIGVPHGDFGEGLVALIVGVDGTAPDENAVITMLKQDLASFKVPRRVIRLNTLPRNVMGKVQKNALRKEYATVFQS